MKTLKLLSFQSTRKSATETATLSLLAGTANSMIEETIPLIPITVSLWKLLRLMIPGLKLRLDSLENQVTNSSDTSQSDHI